MENYGLDLHGAMILEEYRREKKTYERLQALVMERLEKMLESSGVVVNSIDSRIKSEASLAGKLERKGRKYASLADITDILGIRVVTYYNEDVDRIAAMAENVFEVDWANSVDKRKMHQFDSFGYNSLHYVCRLPRELYYDSNMPFVNGIRFELQMRTALQHVWSDIQHDIGYKSDCEIPVEYSRNLSRLAGLLEMADSEFSRIRQGIADYRRRMEALVAKGQLEEVPLDGDTFNAYLDTRPFDPLNERIAAINRAELHDVTFQPYLRVLKAIGMKTLSNVEQMIRENSEDAYQLALYQLGSTDIDILASTIGLQNLCMVYILKGGGGKIGLQRFFDAVNGESEQNAVLADIVMKQAAHLSFLT